MTLFNLDAQEQKNLTAFLRKLVQTPSPSTQEDAVASHLVQEMRQLGFDDVRIDRVGNVVGRIGPQHGPTLMLNGHMDTVRVSNPDAWQHEPFAAQVKQGILYGLGACDMKGGLAAMIYGAKLLKDANLDLQGNLIVACVVQQEPCEGTGSRILIEEEGIKPDWVVLAEPTDMNISRGQRGRMEVHLVTQGCAAHAARPDLGENAIYTAARLVFGLELLGGQLGNDDFLGRGSLAVTEIASNSCSRNAVPDRCELIIDRRLTVGENETMALSEIQRVVAREGVQATVTVNEYQITSYTGYTCHGRAFHPVWIIAEDHPLVRTAEQAVRAQTKRRPSIGSWDFSTEGAYTAGVAGIPTVGFGPGDPHCTHASDDHIRLADVHAAAGVYAQLAARLIAG